MYLRFQWHVSFPYFQSCVQAMKTSSAYSDTLTDVDRVDFLLVGDKHESFVEKITGIELCGWLCPQRPTA